MRSSINGKSGRVARNRLGLITPMVAVALLVVLAAVALVLDRLWLDAASVELGGAVEAAALGAAAQLATDDLLRENADFRRTIARARWIASDIARRNLVAGTPLELDRSPDGDVRFGRLVFQKKTGHSMFLETEHEPRSAAVIARRTKNRNNPVALFFRSLTGQSAGDVVVRAVASVDNRLVALRPFDGVPVPALPLAILESDPHGHRRDTWDLQIEKREGPDEYAYNPLSHRTEKRPDGIPEIVLRIAASRLHAIDGNAQLVDVCSSPAARATERGSVSLVAMHHPSWRGLEETGVVRQVVGGWTVNDLKWWGGELRLDGAPVDVSGIGFLNSRLERAILELKGDCRICMLYSGQVSADQGGGSTVHCVRFVAGRVLAVRKGEDQSREIVFQPGVLTTRTAVLDTSSGPSTRNAVTENPYIYKLQLTR